MELKDRLIALVRSLPPAQRAGIVVAVAVLAMAAVPFLQWVTTPSYSLLYAGLEDTELAEVVDELETRGVAYELDGSRVLVPRDQLHVVRADLAQAGVSGSPSVPGYELLDAQALGVSDFKQRVDLQRAVEGELSRTLAAMDGIETATVRLVLPEDELFTEQQEPASASVLLRPTGELDAGQVEAVTLLVSSAVEGLAPQQITVADTAGNVLHTPGDGGAGGTSDRHQRRTRAFEAAMNSDLQTLVQRATGNPVAVTVRATLDFDESEVQTEVYDDDAVTLREQTSAENYEGAGAAAGGTVGVDGGPLPGGAGEGTYEREDATREFGVSRTTTRTVEAPGSVERLSVALVVDEAAEASDAELRELVGAAAGIDAELREDAIAITRVVTPAPEAPEELPEPGLLADLERYLALAVLILVAIGLFLMARRRREPEVAEKVVPAQVRPAAPAIDEPEEEPVAPAGPSVQDEVAAMVERQPEEIAALLRGWLADRRSTV